MGNYDDALEVVEIALKTAPRNSRLLLSRAEALELSGDLDGARRAFSDGSDVAQRYGDAGFFQSNAMFELRSAGVIEALRAARQEIRRSHQMSEKPSLPAWSAHCWTWSP